MIRRFVVALISNSTGLKWKKQCEYLITHYPQGFSGIIFNTGWGTFFKTAYGTVYNYWKKEYWCPLCECEFEIGHHTGGLGFRDVAFLSKNTRKSNRLQMSLERQHFLLNCLITLSVGLADVWTCGFPLGRPALINWFLLYWQLWGWNWVGVVSNSTMELFRDAFSSFVAYWMLRLFIYWEKVVQHSSPKTVPQCSSTQFLPSLSCNPTIINFLFST